MGMRGRHAPKFGRKKKLGRPGRDDAAVVHELMYYYELRDGPGLDGPSEEVLRQNWEDYGRYFFIKHPGWQHRNPGRRPWAFWRFDFTPPDDVEKYRPIAGNEAELIIALGLASEREVKQIREMQKE